jgi:hypothetical protein
MMRNHRANARKAAQRCWGACFLFFLVLSLLLSMLQPGPALAQEENGDVWFTVTFQGGGSYKLSWDAEGTAYVNFDFINYVDPIDIYKDGRAYKEYNNTYDDGWGYTTEQHATFEGEYNSKTRTLTGRYESSYKQSDEGYEITETFTGTLEGTLEYRPQQYSGDELVRRLTASSGIDARV